MAILSVLNGLLLAVVLVLLIQGNRLTRQQLVTSETERWGPRWLPYVASATLVGVAVVLAFIGLFAVDWRVSLVMLVLAAMLTSAELLMQADVRRRLRSEKESSGIMSIHDYRKKYAKDHPGIRAPK